jgi:hypothetical protein
MMELEKNHKENRAENEDVEQEGGFIEMDRAEVLQQLEYGQIDVETAVELLLTLPASIENSSSPTESVVRMNILERLERGEMDAEEALGFFNEPVEDRNEESLEMGILQQIESGQLSAEEAVHKLEEQSVNDAKPAHVVSDSFVEETDAERELLRSRSRAALLSISIFVSALGGWLASLGGWWWLGAAPLMLIGVPLLVLVIVSWRSTWLYVHVKTTEEWPEKISLCFPLPLRLAGWAIRNFGSCIPAMHGSAVDELLIELEQGLQRNQPLSIEVEETDGGEQVRVYLG